MRANWENVSERMPAALRNHRCKRRLTGTVLKGDSTTKEQIPQSLFKKSRVGVTTWSQDPFRALLRPPRSV